MPVALIGGQTHKGRRLAFTYQYVCTRPGRRIPLQLGGQTIPMQPGTPLARGTRKRLWALLATTATRHVGTWRTRRLPDWMA
ncbi:MAG TPA: hypothetical protein VGF67_06765 [Ktedonobacteraceae bacterium]|jgi:hypothetical protein